MDEQIIEMECSCFQNMGLPILKNIENAKDILNKNAHEQCSNLLTIHHRAYTRVDHNTSLGTLLAPLLKGVGASLASLEYMRVACWRLLYVHM